MGAPSMTMVAPEITAYLDGLLPDEEPFLASLRARAEEDRVPIVEPEVAGLLRFLLALHRPRRILEIGTAVAYSTLVMAHNMPEGEIVTIERYAPYLERAKANVAAYDGPVQITQLEGEALDHLEALEGQFDMIFIDAAKGHYRKFFDRAYPHLAPGGLILSDNVLYKGMIASDAYVVRRKKTIVKRMRRYLDYLYAHPELTTTVLPMGDGVAISHRQRESGDAT